MLAPATGGALTFTWLLDQTGESPCGSRLRPVQAVSPTCYDTFDDDTPSTWTALLLSVDAPTLGDLSDGDYVTLHGFFLPPPLDGESFHSLDIDLAFTFLTLGLANLGTEQAVIPDTSFVIDELVGTLVETGPGLFAVTFPTFPIYWSGERPSSGLTGSGILPFTLSTEQTYINVDSTTPPVPGVSPWIPGTCTGGSTTFPGVGYPNFPLPAEASDFAFGSRFVMGGATCPSGLASVTNLPERAFSIELQGWLLPTLVAECDDGIDNDRDGLVDWPADVGCDDPTDASEHSPALPCDDGQDDDGDGGTDFDPATVVDPLAGTGDPSCEDPSSPTETTRCQDGIDNDGDGAIDFDGGASLDLDADGFVDAEFNPQQPAVTAPDSRCLLPWHDREGRTGCGLGFELVLLLPLASWLRQRRRRAHHGGRPPGTLRAPEPPRG